MSLQPNPGIINPKVIEISSGKEGEEPRPIFPGQTDRAESLIFDKDWIKTAFMVSDQDIQDADDIKNRYYTSAHSKFTDGRLGCNIGINPRPQWTRYADIRVKGRLAPTRNNVSLGSTTGNYGMGRAYSEGIDDPAQKIFLRFGVPRFNSLLDYLLNAFDRRTAIAVRTGRAPSAWYNAGAVIGKFFMLTTFPFLTVAVEAGKAAAWLFGRGTSKFFTLKPTMHFYWGMVNSMVNNHAVNTGIIKKFLSDENEQRLGRPYKLDEDQIADLQALMPDVFHPQGFIDVYAMANKAQRLANAMFQIDYDHLNNGTPTNFYGYLKRENSGNGRHSTYLSNDKGGRTLSSFLNDLVLFGDYYTSPDEEADAKEQKLLPELSPFPSTKAIEEAKAAESEYKENIIKHMDAEWRDGSQFAVFRVDHTGSVSESFGNSTAESEISQKMNQVSAQFKEARFSLADGNLTGGIIDSIATAVKDTAMGALDSVSLGFSGLVAGLGGSGFVDIPKHWVSSSASLPRGSYTIQLISPYNNPISRLINIWIPFYMLLAGALPRSTGKQSYGSPFYCQIYDRGRLQSRLAMIESISIQRGTSNLAFDLSGQCLAIDVSLNVVDLSTIMHMPMSGGKLLEIDMTMDDDNIAADYLNVLAGMDIYSQIYPIPRAQLKATKELLKLRNKAYSPAFHASLFKNSAENGFLNDISFGLTGALSGGMGALVAGASSIDGQRN